MLDKKIDRKEAANMNCDWNKRSILFFFSFASFPNSNINDLIYNRIFSKLHPLYSAVYPSRIADQIRFMV